MAINWSILKLTNTQTFIPDKILNLARIGLLVETSIVYDLVKANYLIEPAVSLCCLGFFLGFYQLKT